jgi:hypothetical protein
LSQRKSIYTTISVPIYDKKVEDRDRIRYVKNTLLRRLATLLAPQHRFGKGTSEFGSGRQARELPIDDYTRWGNNLVQPTTHRRELDPVDVPRAMVP